MNSLDFKRNTFPTVGVELELQLVDLYKYDLAMEAQDFLRRMTENIYSGELKPEITQSMIEINSSVHQEYHSLVKELHRLRDLIVSEAEKTHIGVCGGGTHPFQKWKDQRIFHNERFASVSEQYGYLAKQFTVFGQHIHIGCENGDDALYLCHALARYIPHFVALSASSPFTQGVDTAFDCSRLTVISAFPLSGTPPWILCWEDFQNYFNQLAHLEIIKTMKDFYWDIRPKPEYGTVELRICDTPLTVKRAADIATYVQVLSVWLLEQRSSLSPDMYLTYLVNRFRASRYGLEAILVDPIQKTKFSLAEEILAMLHNIAPVAARLKGEAALDNIRQLVLNGENDASWLRNQYRKLQSLNDTVRLQTELWKGNFSTVQGIT